MKIIIAGAGAVGTHLAKLLSGEKQDIILMDDDEERLGRLGSNFDLLAVNISPTSISGLKEAGVAGADLFIAVTPDESRNMTACMLATSLGAKRQLHESIITSICFLSIKSFCQTGSRLPNLSGNAGSERNCRCRKDELDSSMVGVRWRSISFALTKMKETAEILNVPLHELGGRNIPFHIVAIKRGSETIIPRGDDTIILNDIVYFTTTKNIFLISGKLLEKRMKLISAT